MPIVFKLLIWINHNTLLQVDYLFQRVPMYFFSSSPSLLHITHTYYVFVMLHIFGRYFFPFHFISHVFIVCCTHIMRKEMKFLINNASSQHQLTYKDFDECLGPGNMYTLHCYLYKQQYKYSTFQLGPLCMGKLERTQLQATYVYRLFLCF